MKSKKSLGIPQTKKIESPLSSENLFEDVKTILEKHWKDFKEIFDKKNIARKDCLLLPLRTILKALKT